MNITERIEYIVALINEFAAHYHITDAQAVEYLVRYGAIAMCDEHYNVMHTLSFRDNVEGLSAYCNRKGGNLIFG